MRLSDTDPYVRFAAEVRGSIMNTAVRVTDCRIFYLEEGSVCIYIDDECCRMEKNSLFYCRGGSTYRVQAATGSRLISVNFDLTRSHAREPVPFPVCAGQAQWEGMAVYYDPVEDSPFLNGHLLIEDALWLQENIRELVQEHGENTHLSSLLCGSLLKSLLLRLHRAKRQEMPQKLTMVKEYIRTNYMQELTNRQIAELAGYHEYYLNRIFQAYTGMNIHQYLVKVRMEQAAYLMLNTDLALSAIAEQVGIRSYPHFSACFKNCYGCSPAQYRSRYAERI